MASWQSTRPSREALPILPWWECGETASTIPWQTWICCTACPEGITGEILTGNARLMTLTGKLALTSGVGRQSLIPFPKGAMASLPGLVLPLVQRFPAQGLNLGHQ